MTQKLYSIAILAGGLAMRLRPITATIPKSLVPINNEPFIYHQLRLLHRQGIREVVLCLGYLGEMVQACIGNGKTLGLNVQYSLDGDRLLGTGGALKRALPLLSDDFFVLYGDSFLTCDYAAVQNAYQAQKKSSLMTVFHNRGLGDRSNVEFQHGQIVQYDKINRNLNMHYIDYGLGILSKTAFQWVPDDQPYDLTLLYQQLLKQDELAAFEVSQRFYEVGSFEGIKELEYYLANVNSP